MTKNDCWLGVGFWGPAEASSRGGGGNLEFVAARHRETGAKAFAVCFLLDSLLAPSGSIVSVS